MQSDLETYIVQVESPESHISTQPSRMDLESWYNSFMLKTIEIAGSDEKPQLIYSYHNVIIGFAARLSAKQVKEMEKKPGVTPDHPSFSDEGMPPPPAKLKGKCNNKLIGAKTYPLKSESPKDEAEHGTHTSSTAAGSFVKGANVSVHYLVAPIAEILAGMDEAIDDGVDIMSLSLGGGSRPFYYDVIALGAYSAAKRGIL
ncbi:hypothetical protein EJD97_013591, partial [Solanum chilense]